MGHQPGQELSRDLKIQPVVVAAMSVVRTNIRYPTPVEAVGSSRKLTQQSGSMIDPNGQIGEKRNDEARERIRATGAGSLVRFMSVLPQWSSSPTHINVNNSSLIVEARAGKHRTNNKLGSTASRPLRHSIAYPLIS